MATVRIELGSAEPVTALVAGAGLVRGQLYLIQGFGSGPWYVCEAATGGEATVFHRVRPDESVRIRIPEAGDAYVSNRSGVTHLVATEAD